MASLGVTGATAGSAPLVGSGPEAASGGPALMAPAASPATADGAGDGAGASTVVAVKSLAAQAGQAASDDLDSTAGKAAPAPKVSVPAIGTQMVLVFDDQTRTMAVKILDIETQKVDQQLPLPLDPVAAAALASASGASAAAADSASAAATRVDTKA